jgi:hypothetical protein
MASREFSKCGKHKGQSNRKPRNLRANLDPVMNFDPQKFFIGLMDFFSILLPGALLTYLLIGEVGPVVLGDRYAKLPGMEAWADFLVASYLLGHLVFLLGSWLDEFYDWARASH